MPAYVLLSRLLPESQRKIASQPELIRQIQSNLERWEATVISNHFLLGEWDLCTVFEVSDNLRAQHAVLQDELTNCQESILLPAIDLPLFTELVKKEIRTEGPHHWQIAWWARLTRMCFMWYHTDRWVWRYFKPFHVTGRENLSQIDGPCIIVGNHTSHFDTLALQGCLPVSIRSNLFTGAAADRWFLRKGGGRRELALQPWYNSLIAGNFPIRRGGGSATLDYSRWLLKNHASLMIFPEGTRSTSRHMARFKHGVSILALDCNVPVLPVYLTGVNKIRPKGTREITPGPVWAHIQPPLTFEPGTPVPDATRQIYDRLNAPHQRVLEEGPEAGRWDYSGRG